MRSSYTKNAFYTFDTLGILHAEFGSFWTTPWPDEKDLFLKLIIREILKFPYEKLNFFLGKLYQKFFLFYTLHTLGILHTEFGLIWTTPWPDEKDLYLKLFIWNNSKFPYEKRTFFLGKLYQKFVLFYTFDTLGILHAEFGSIWTTPWPDEKDLFLKLIIRDILKFPYEKLNFFQGKLYQQYFLFYTLHTLGILHTEFGLIWTTPWPDEKDLYLKLFIWNNSKFPYEKRTFFLGKLYQKCVLFYTFDTLGILHAEFGLFWTIPWPDEKDLFLKLIIREILKFPYEKLTFFLGKLYQQFFLFYTLHTLGILHTEFGLVWTTPWPDEKALFLKLFIWNNGKFPYEKLTFFLGKLYQKFVLLYTFDTLGILHAGFGLIWTTPWPDKKDLFLNLFIWNNSKFLYEKLTLFLGKLYQKFVLFYTFDTLGILHAEFGSIWTTPWPDEKDLFLKLIIRDILKFPYEKLNFFLDKLYQQFFLFYTLHTLGILHTEFGLIWTTPWPDEKDLYLKLFIWNNSKFPYEKRTFFLGKLYQKFVLFYTFDTLGILHAEFGSIWTTPWPDEKDLFLKLIIREILKIPYEKLTFFLGKLYQQFFLFYILHTLGILHTEFGLVWTTPWPDEKALFLKLLIWNNGKFPYEKLTFFLGKLYQKFVLLYTFDTLGILHAGFGLIWTTPWPDKKDLFLNLFIWNNSKFLYEKLTLFLGKLYQKFVLFYTFDTLGILHAGFSLIWTTPWPDKKTYF